MPFLRLKWEFCGCLWVCMSVTCSFPALVLLIKRGCLARKPQGFTCPSFQALKLQAHGLCTFKDIDSRDWNPVLLLACPTLYQVSCLSRPWSGIFKNLELNAFHWYQGINLIVKKKMPSFSSKSHQKQTCIWQVEFVTASINQQGIRSHGHCNKSVRSTLGFGLLSGGFKGLPETGFTMDWIFSGS